MNKKLTFPELAELLSAATNTSKRMSELFLRELFSEISQTLIKGESVSIKNFGSFKLSDVSPRMSRDVNTGLPIEIPGHKKIIFTPDKVMADAVNASFASFEAVILDDDVTSEMFDEIDAMVEVSSSQEVVAEQIATEPKESQDVLQTSEVETTENDVEKDIPSNGEVADEENSSSADSDAAESDNSSEKVDETDVETDVESNVETTGSSQPEPEDLNEKVSNDTPAEVEEEQKEKAQEEVIEDLSQDGTESNNESEELEKTVDESVQTIDDEVEDEEPKSDGWFGRHKFLLGFVSGTVFWAVVVSLFVCFAPVVSWINGDKDEEDLLLDDTIVENQDSIVDVFAPQVVEDTLKAEVEEKTVKPAEPVVVTDTITKSKFLSRIARKHYGNNHFWVYIYEENKDVIKNPNNVSSGTVIVIPPAEKYGIDKDNEESVEKARRKAAEIQQKFS